ncbi:MAG: nuclear transport factor 2 family protein [Pseudomonadota bacterium]
MSGPLEDEQALRDLMATYLDAVYRNDGEAWKATWTEDSEWNLVGNAVTGRDNIYAMWQGAMASFEFAMMVPSIGKFEIDGDVASGFWYLQEFTRDHDGNTSCIVSRYLDTYVRENGRWLYKSRHYDFIYNGPADLSGNFMPLPGAG